MGPELTKSRKSMEFRWGFEVFTRYTWRTVFILSQDAPRTFPTIRFFSWFRHVEFFLHVHVEFFLHVHVEKKRTCRALKKNHQNLAIEIRFPLLFRRLKCQLRL